MKNLNECLLELEEELTQDNYPTLLTLIMEQHRRYNFDTPQNAMIALLSIITQEEGKNIGEYCRDNFYVDVKELLIRARNY